MTQQNNQLMAQLWTNYSAILNKTTFQQYYQCHKLENNKIATPSLAYLFFSVLEKVLILGFYVFMFLILDFQRIDVATFLIFANIILVYNTQLDYFLKIVFQMYHARPSLPKFTTQSFTYQPTMVLTFGQQVVEKHYLTIQSHQLANLLVDYQSIINFIQTNQVYITAQACLNQELISNNLFNFGATTSLKTFKTMQLGKYLEKYQLSLTDYANEQLTKEQQSLLGLLSACFCQQKIVLVEKTNLVEYCEIKKQMIAFLTDKFLIFLEN